MNMIQIPIQLQLQLPLLIADKITNYLSFTTWRERMDKICQEYNQVKSEYPTSDGIYIHAFSYNYRDLNELDDFCTWHGELVYNKTGDPVSKLSPNY